MSEIIKFQLAAKKVKWHEIKNFSHHIQIIYQNDRRDELIKINLLQEFFRPPGGASEHLKVAKMHIL